MGDKNTNYTSESPELMSIPKCTGDKKIKFTSEWRPFSELRLIPQNISSLGYKKEYIEEHNLKATKIYHWGNLITGVTCYFEPLEIKADGNGILWRYNENHIHMDEPERFETQFGTFNNHNHGEFTSWLGKDGYDGLSQEEKKRHSLFGRDDFFVEGNYCDMFDCGKYSYAVSNQMHMGLGDFKIVRIDRELNAVTLYSNSDEEGWTSLEYQGRFENGQGYTLIVSGCTRPNRTQPDLPRRDRTLLIQIDNCGNCAVIREWDYRISSSNSMAEVDGFIYFGQNKMITRLNVEIGELEFFTNKTDDELAALVKV